MGEAIGAILSEAVAVAISPVPIIAVILMLFTKRSRGNSLAFLAGWLVGLSVVGAIVLAIAAVGDLESSEGGESTASWIIKLVLGVLFLALAYRNWSTRPRGVEEPEMPKWMAAIDEFTVPKSFGLAFLLSAINPKNLMLTLSAATTIAAAGLSGAEQIVVLAVFVILASLTVAAPVLVYLFAGHRADATLDRAKDWLIANNSTIMAVLLLVIGVKLIGDGLGGLSG